MFRLAVCLLFASTAFPQSYATHSDETLAALIDEALERNPGVREAFARYRAALQKAPQLGALPDPQLGATYYVQSPETRTGPQISMVSISQRFPWRGKLRDRAGVAEKEAAAMGEAYEAQKDEAVRRLKLAYYDLAFADESVAITGEEIELLRRFEEFARARYAQGAGPQQAVLRLQAELTRAESRLDELRRRRGDAEATVNALTARESGEPIQSAALPATPKLDLDARQLSALARDTRPELQAGLLRIEREEKRIQAARREALPDLTLGAGAGLVADRRDAPGVLMPPPDNGKNVYMLTAAINLPLFRRKYRAGVLEASENFVAEKEAYRNTANEIDAAIRALVLRFETLASQVELFRRQLMPQAEESLRSAETAYATGQVGVLDLIDGERMLIDVRLGTAQLRSDLFKTLAELERAVGADILEARP